jgi:hypothetical protein
VALETILRATCEPTRFIDLIENFLLFEDARGGLRKVLAKYHQVLGVSNYKSWRVAEICAICDRLGIDRPVVSQPYYNAMNRMLNICIQM